MEKEIETLNKKEFSEYLINVKEGNKVFKSENEGIYMVIITEINKLYKIVYGIDFFERNVSKIKYITESQYRDFKFWGVIDNVLGKVVYVDYKLKKLIEEKYIDETSIDQTRKELNNMLCAEIVKEYENDELIKKMKKAGKWEQPLSDNELSNQKFYARDMVSNYIMEGKEDITFEEYAKYFNNYFNYQDIELILDLMHEHEEVKRGYIKNVINELIEYERISQGWLVKYDFVKNELMKFYGERNKSTSGYETVMKAVKLKNIAKNNSECNTFTLKVKNEEGQIEEVKVKRNGLITLSILYAFGNDITDIKEENINISCYNIVDRKVEYRDKHKDIYVKDVVDVLYRGTSLMERYKFNKEVQV